MPRPYTLQDVISNLQDDVSNSLNNEVTTPSGPNSCFSYDWESMINPTDTVSVSNTQAVTVQNVNYNVGSLVSSIGVTISTNSGSPLLVWYSCGTNAYGISSISDTFSGHYTWTEAASTYFYVSGTDYPVQLWIGTGGSGTSGTVTATLAGSNSPIIAIMSFNNASTASGTSALDNNATYTSGSTSSTTLTGPNITPTANGELGLYFFRPAASTNITSDGSFPFTPIPGMFLTVGSDIVLISDSATPISGYQTTCTLQSYNSTTWCAIGVTLKT